MRARVWTRMGECDRKEMGCWQNGDEVGRGGNVDVMTAGIECWVSEY